jgi:hypothetical protein
LFKENKEGDDKVKIKTGGKDNNNRKTYGRPGV